MRRTILQAPMSMDTGTGSALGVDRPDYLRLLRCFDALARAVLHPSVTRRAASYESHPSWVSIQPSEPKSAEADPGACRELPGAGPSARFGSEASPRTRWQAVQSSPLAMCRLACRTGISASPCLDAGATLAEKSTGRKNPIASGGVRMFQNVSEPSDAAASGLSGCPHAGFHAPRSGLPYGLRESAKLAKT